MDKKNLVLGVDIGGSKINIVVWDRKKIVDRWQTDNVTPDALMRGILKFNISSVGIGAAAVLDFKTGTILSSPNLKNFEGICLKKFGGRNVRFDNDVHCFLRAESEFGSARGYKNVLALAMGTGIGGAIKMGENPVYFGAHGSAGEFGFMVLKNKQTWEKLYQKTKRNSEKQKQIHALGFANLINAFDPEIIILGGNGAKLPGKNLMKKLILSPLAKNTKIILGELGGDAVAIGAALLWN